MAKKPLVIIIILLVTTLFGGALLHNKIIETLGHNPIANSAILIMMIIGIGYSFFCTFALWRGQVQWSLLENDVGEWQTLDKLNGVLRFFDGRLHRELGHKDSETRDEIIDLFEENLDYRVRLIEYFSGLLIGLGLFGTFIGLMSTIGTISSVLDTLKGNASMDAMLSSLAGPLAGMSSAFSASLMGLFGSLLMSAIGQFMAEAVKTLIHNIRSWSQKIQAVTIKNEVEMRQGTIGNLAESSSGIIPGINEFPTGFYAYLQNNFQETMELFLSETRNQNLLMDKHFSELVINLKSSNDNQVKTISHVDEILKCIMNISEQNETILADRSIQREFFDMTTKQICEMQGGIIKLNETLEINRLTLQQAVNTVNDSVNVIASKKYDEEQFSNELLTAFSRSVDNINKQQNKINEYHFTLMEFIKTINKRMMKNDSVE